MKTAIAKLAVSAATYHIDKPYTYAVPKEMQNKLHPGMRVTVPFGRGNRKCEAFVLATDEGEDEKSLKSIESVLDNTPVLEPWQLKLAMWMGAKFFCTVYEAARTMLPVGMWYKDGKRNVNDKTELFAQLHIPGDEALAIAETIKKRSPAKAAVLKLLAEIGGAWVSEIAYFTGVGKQSVTRLEKDGYIELMRKEVFRRPEIKASENGKISELNCEQQSVLNGLIKQCDIGASAALLYGVTGSGKTSVYIKLIEHVLSRGRDAIILVPEISLTPQLMSIFAANFGDNIAVLHSMLGIGERYDEWKRIKSGQVHVVIGTRSAIFAPVENLGLIILDEEQEATYKSENNPRYHAREVAKYRCAHSGAMLLMGSATPSVESMYSALAGKYALYKLTHRFNNANLPEVVTVDMKEELQAGNGGDISRPLAREIERNLKTGQQTILFLNRRGANSLVTCGACGYTFTCDRCSVSLTYHRANGRLMCHYCGYSRPATETCPQCGSQLNYLGSGTQKVEEELHELFPDASVLRMDADTVSAAKSHEKILREFKDRKADILLGTQMVTKGLDFENVTLVGVLSADRSLYVNDYRARERTFSMITQVVGRAGRGDKPGRAVIQTFTPQNPVIVLASCQNYDGFYEEEIKIRRSMHMPPFAALFIVTASGVIETDVMRACARVKAALNGYLAGENLKILGPAPALVTKINNRFRYRITVLGKDTKKLRDTIAHVVKQVSRDKTCRGVSVYADREPADL